MYKAYLLFGKLSSILCGNSVKAKGGIRIVRRAGLITFHTSTTCSSADIACPPREYRSK